MSKILKPGNRRISRRIMAITLLFAIACYMLFMPNTIRDSLWHNTYRDWLSIKAEPYSGVITLWHIVSFRPYIGSLGAWLDSRAAEYASQYIGVYFEVESYTQEEANEQLLRGRLPDMISFAHGTYGTDGLLTLNAKFETDTASGVYGGSLFAVPFCASGLLLLYDPIETKGMTQEQIEEIAGTMDEFKNGNANSCIADAKAAGDLYRAETAGKGRYFEAVPYQSTTQLVQYISISNAIVEEKISYAIGFIQHIISANAQSTLADVGLIPMNPLASTAYGLEWLTAMANAFDVKRIMSCFDAYYSKKQ